MLSRTNRCLSGWSALRNAASLILCPLLAFYTSAPIAFGQDALHRLNIVIVEGDGAINNIKQRTTREPIVEVQDENHRPVAGAAVVFALPTGGPGATFAGGLQNATFITDQSGRAVARGMKLNRINGKFQVKVTASSQGRVGSTTITQTNVGAAAATLGATGISLKVLLILAAVAGAGAGGAYAATHSGSSRPNTGITIGSPTVGPPR